MTQNGHPRPRLLPRLATLAGIHVVLSLVPINTITGAACIASSIIFTAWIVSSTLQAMRRSKVLHQQDEWILYHSGPIAVLACLLIVAAYFVVDSSKTIEHWMIASSHVGFVAFLFTVEVGFVAALACTFLPLNRPHLRPYLFWWAASFPLFIVFGSLVLILSFNPAGGRCE